MPVSIELARKGRDIDAGENLLEQARGLHARALGILERAEAAGQLETALKAIREVRGILELLGKLSGQIEERGAGKTEVTGCPRGFDQSFQKGASGGYR